LVPNCKHAHGDDVPLASRGVAVLIFTNLLLLPVLLSCTGVSAAAAARSLRAARAEDAEAFLTNTGLDAKQFAADIDGKFMGAFIRATKPETKPAACCAPGCCD